jgi:hypothetical protein
MTRDEIVAWLRAEQHRNERCATQRDDLSYLWRQARKFEATADLIEQLQREQDAALASRRDS